MSMIRTTLEISPSPCVSAEHMRTPPMQCPQCHGRGFFDTGRPEPDDTMECPFCEGSGMVAAVIAINWEPYHYNA